ncbi:MAG: hypothetical protein WBZ42_02025 [Halobacteriota archaeon]
MILSDGDNTYPLEVATEMVRLLQTNDVVLGSRLKGSVEPSAMTKMNVVGNILLSAIARLLFNARIVTCARDCGISRRRGQVLGLSAQGFEIEADMFTESSRKRLSMPKSRFTTVHARAKPSSLQLGMV